MLHHPRNKSRELLTLKALESRISSSHPAKETILSDLKKKYAEINGEKEIIYRLNFLDSKKYRVLHNIRLKDENGYFQMDSIVLSNAFIVDIDAKNWLGVVRFGANGQVTRVHPDGTKEGIQNPVDQVKTQALRLKRWLLHHKFPPISIKYFSVISFPSTIIERESSQDIVPQEFFHSSQLIFQIQEIEKSYQTHIYSNSQLYDVANLLESSHQPFEQDIFKKYNLTSKDILRGVFCPECSALPMIRKSNNWLCRSCHYSSIDAHKQALMDFSLLFGDWITNKQARSFLHISSPKIVRSILKKECKTAIGKNRGRKYKLIY